MADSKASTRRPLACKSLALQPTSEPGTQKTPFEWRADLQAVAFMPEGHGALCMIHRLAIRTLAGRLLGAQECLDFARSEHQRLQAAAREKIRLKQVPSGRSLHLTSRDVRRLSPAQAGEPGPA